MPRIGLIVAQLNEALCLELVSVVRYTLHSHMCDLWGYPQLGTTLKLHARNEAKHAEELMDRILLLKGEVCLQGMCPPAVSGTLRDQLKDDVAFEAALHSRYESACQVCAIAGDEKSQALFARLARDQVKHQLFLEAYLATMNERCSEDCVKRQLHWFPKRVSVLQ